MASRWVWTRLDPTRPDRGRDGGDGVVVFPEPVVADRRSLALPLVCNQVKLRAALASHFSERDVEFFVREIADNRVKKVGEFVNSKLAARRAAAHSYRRVLLHTYLHTSGARRHSAIANSRSGCGKPIQRRRMALITLSMMIVVRWPTTFCGRSCGTTR